MSSSPFMFQIINKQSFKMISRFKSQQMLLKNVENLEFRQTMTDFLINLLIQERAEFQYIQQISGQRQRDQMKSKSSSKQVNSISSFIDSLLSPPLLSNPLKKSSSQKNLNDSITISKQINSPEPKIPQIKLSPVKKQPKSEDKASHMFNNSKNYVEQISMENSMIISRTSELNDSRTKGGFTNKEVKFRQNLIMRNSHYKKQFARNNSRTPSILKKSQQVRNSTIQFLQSSNIQSRLQSNMQNQTSNIAEDKQGRAIKTNQVVRKRYFTIIERFQAKYANKLKKNIKLRNDQKYKDQLFPPILSSIARGGGKVQQSKTEKFKWMRLSQLYKDSSIVVISGDERSNINIRCQYNNNSFIADAFTSIKNCKTILSKMFEFNEVSQFGVYMIKVFQQNVWKYVIVDDYIPVVQNFEGFLQPFFVNCEKIDQSGCIEIWPYLLQKAYANYYANYESLHYGTTLDFLQEITGISGQVFHFITHQKKRSQKTKRLQMLIQTQDTVFLGLSADGFYIPIQKDYDGGLMAQFYRNQYRYFNASNIYQTFDKVYAFNPANCIYSTVSAIGINIRKTSEAPRFDVSVRIIKVHQAGSVAISIRQKQKRFYQKSSLNYDYIWIRAILLQKQFDGDCRWIDAKYSNLKSLNFFNKLQAGEYYVILLPQWKSSHCYELSLIVNSSVKVTLTKKEYDDRDQLMQKGCCDLAQRFGKLHQINLFACNYSYIHEQIGLLVENINNQRYNGDIKINRSINGLKAAVDLVPFNIEFYQQKNNKLPYKTQISVYIAADKSYTVILMMRGGIDMSFLKKFDFGK